MRRYLNATGLMWESGPGFGAVLVVSCPEPALEVVTPSTWTRYTSGQ
jgi:hypothetical protein